MSQAIQKEQGIICWLYCKNTFIHSRTRGKSTACLYAVRNTQTYEFSRNSRTWKWHYCAVSVKSVRFGIECKQSISNIFLTCHILRHFQDSRHWPWEFYILEMPQYVAYLKNIADGVTKLSANSHSFNILCTIDVLSCPTKINGRRRAEMANTKTVSTEFTGGGGAKFQLPHDFMRESEAFYH